MSRRDDSQTYDPFGEAIDATCPPTAAVEEGRIRGAAIVVFWMVALMLTAGRVYFADHAASPSVAGPAIPVVAVQQIASSR